MPPMAHEMGILGGYILKLLKIFHRAGFGTIHAEISSIFLSFRKHVRRGKLKLAAAFLPDNITSNGKGLFWLALLHGSDGRRSWDPLLSKPFLRKIILKKRDDKRELKRY